MKFIKRLVLFVILILVIFLVSCNDAKDEKNLNIHLIGEEEITIEVKSEYEELGIELPEKYTYEISQDIDTNELGKQEVTYIVYNNKGNKVKELKRTVNVVDTTAPTIIEAKDKTFYLGVGYTINDFIDNYYDNFDNRRNLKISQTEFIFNELGEQDVTITISDSSGNSTKFSKTINVEFNIVKQLQYEYRLKPSVYEIQVSSDDDTGEQIEFIRVQLDMYREYIEGLSIYTGLLYYKRNNSEFGDYAKVRVNYDYYEKVVYPMYYEVWQDGKEVAIIYTPSTRDGNVIRLLKPSVNTNKTAYSLDEIASEAEHYIEDVIISCSEYVRNVLHFEVNEYEEIIWYYN
ncbi:MAG: DUF5011 domain-containing protein [Bacilli bacterium]|nr:DUF5011 domain-containing protein [Bacilli bacterium]